MMKKQLTSYLAGVATTALLVALPVSALATSGWMSIEVDPINIQVNGETFHPTDANGNPVLVFACNGTTYVPLRALAEAYGLEVGYDSSTNMATVSQPTQVQQPLATPTPVPEPSAPTVDFASQWKVTRKLATQYNTEPTFHAVYSGPLNMGEFKAWWKSMDLAELEAAAEQMMAETGCANGIMYFLYDGKMLGQAGSLNGYTFGNFSVSSIWIK